MVRGLFILIAIAAAPWGNSLTVRGATLSDCRLTLDGSSDPPGDRIDCVVLFHDGEARAQLEVRAYLVRAGAEHAPEPIKSLEPRLRDPDGALTIRRDVSPPQSERAAFASIVVPFGALDVPSGEHRIGYEVRLRTNGIVTYTHPLPLTALRVGGGERRELRPRKLGAPQVVVDEVVSALVAGGPRGAPVRRVEMLLQSPAVVANPSTKSARIPRGFERTELDKKEVRNDRLPELADQPWRPAAAVLTPIERTVYYATNRALRPAEKADKFPRFAATRGELTFGQCIVDFPVRNHRRGQLERPDWWSSAEPDKHFLIEALQPLADREVFEKLSQDDVLLFVHGFANNFDDAVLRTAQLAYDVKFPGKPLTFTWPSQGEASLKAYADDEKQAMASARDLADLLARLSARGNGKAAASARPPKVHLIVHSLGNRIVLQAAYLLVEQGTWQANERRLGQTILAAPDVGAAEFNNLIGYLVGASDRVTYYYSKADMALSVSQQSNKYEPVGKYPYFEQGLDTINVDGAGTDFLGHGYYSSSIKVLADFELLLTYGYDPAKRVPPLGAQTRVYGHEHWSFLPLETRITPAPRGK